MSCCGCREPSALEGGPGLGRAPCGPSAPPCPSSPGGDRGEPGAAAAQRRGRGGGAEAARTRPYWGKPPHVLLCLAWPRETTFSMPTGTKGGPAPPGIQPARVACWTMGATPALPEARDRPKSSQSSQGDLCDLWGQEARVAGSGPGGLHVEGGPGTPPGPGGKGSVGRAQVCKGRMSGG